MDYAFQYQRLVLAYHGCNQSVADEVLLKGATLNVDQNHDSPTYDSVRGLFQEDEPAFEGSAIKLKSHIQIAVRDPSCILGYFRPS